MSPPAWIQGTWSSGIIDADYTFTTSTMLQRSSITTLDMAALFREMDISPDETITATLYSFTVPDAGEGSYTMEFAKIDANTIHMTMRFAYATIGPVPLHRQ